MNKYIPLLILFFISSGCLSNEEQIQNYAKSYGIEEGAKNNHFSNTGIQWYFDKYGPDLPKFEIELYVTDVYDKPYVFAIDPMETNLINKVIDGKVYNYNYVTLYSNYRSSESFTFEQAVKSFDEKGFIGKDILLIASLKGINPTKNKKVLDFLNDPQFVVKKFNIPKVDESLVAINLRDVDIEWCNLEQKAKSLPGEKVSSCEDYLNSLRLKLHPRVECVNTCLNNPSYCREDCCQYLLEDYVHNPSIKNYNFYMARYYDIKKSLNGIIICDTNLYSQIKIDRGW